MTFIPSRRLHLLLMTTLCLAGVARAQTSGACVAVSGVVSGTVALSFDQGARASDDGARAASSSGVGRALVITISGTERGLARVSIPILIRSNTGYRLLAAAKSDGAKLADLSVVEARPAGKLVAADAEALRVPAMFDGRPGAGKSIPGGGPSLTSPQELLSGPRVSLGGTLLSPQNALEVTLSVAVEPGAGGEGWAIDLLLTAEPGTRF
ncbi:MAG TPA: hypothetical protein VN282_07770 [Pyrinomonadaceae bacterium]|nr:hypothetical protein [Pyrinomonadaceae bacterium]